jgi:histidinol-phosphatase
VPLSRRRRGEPRISGPPLTASAPLRAAVAAARTAGRIALRYFSGTFAVALKADRTPVTEADREAEEAIVTHLRAAFPDVGFLGEELGATGPQGRRWIVDPIDGTRNFVRGIPYWATLIALEEEGEITAGVVHAPATGDLLWAERGRGAFANGTPLRVSHVDRLDQATLVHSSLGYLRQLDEGRYWDGFVRLVDRTATQRGFGDYLAYTFLLRGQAELMVECDVKPWDLAPFQVLFAEAGGRLTDFAGQATIYSGSVLASNGRLHAEALRLLTPADS